MRFFKVIIISTQLCKSLNLIIEQLNETMRNVRLECNPNEIDMTHNQTFNPQK